MLKHIVILTLSAAALLLAGCSGRPKDISDLKDATPADSMMYYFGEMQAAAYWIDAETDTILTTQEAREEFIKGFRTAMNLSRKEAAYNKGLQLGLRLSIRLNEFERRYDTDFSEEILASSLENYLEKGSGSIDLGAAQRGYYAIKDRLELEAADRELGDAKKNLSRFGSSRGFAQVNDTLYARDITPAGSGTPLKEGDRIAVKISVSSLDGKEIVTRQFPDSITLGEGRVPLIVRYAIYTMTEGQTRQFMTTPRILFGKGYSAYKVPYDEPVIFTIKVQK